MRSPEKRIKGVEDVTYTEERIGRRERGGGEEMGVKENKNLEIKS